MLGNRLQLGMFSRTGTGAEGNCEDERLVRRMHGSPKVGQNLSLAARMPKLTRNADCVERRDLRDQNDAKKLKKQGSRRLKERA